MKKLLRLLRIAPLALLFAGVASAQNNGVVIGVVTDGATGKPVVGAVVIATSPAAQGEQTAVTDNGGNFRIENLPPGNYALSVQMEGYKPGERGDLVVRADTTLRANLAVVPEAVKMEEIVVTGSRIRRKDLTTPAPVTVVSREQIQAAGRVSVGDFLQSLPEQGNTVNTQVNNGNDGSVNVNLRSLGAQRTLVLVNGRRMVAGGTLPTDAVDLNTIPSAAVERLEILKDGASAVYGSDAVAGVVNVILKKRYTGTEISAFTGTSQRGDATIYDIAGTTGAGSERGNILFSIGYQEQQAAFAGDRKWAETTYDFEGDFGKSALVPTGNSSTFPEGRFGIPSVDTTCATTPADPELAALCAAYNAVPPDDATNSFVPGSGGFAMYQGDLFNTNPTNYLITPNRRIQVFSTGDTNFGNVARGFFEASYVNRTSSQNLAPMPLVNNSIPTSPITISKDSLYNPFGADITSWRKRMVEFGNRDYSQDLDTFRVVTGLDGSLGDFAGPLSGWTWELSYNYGRTAGTQITEGQLRMPNVANAVGPSMIDPATNNPICVRVAGDADTAIPGCVPMNVIGGVGNLAANGTTVQDVRNYVTFTGTDRSFVRQEIFSANVGGDLVRLMADRPVGLAFGYDFRRESGRYTPDPITGALESSGNNYLPTSGGYDVHEGYAELSLPIVSGMVGVEDLEVSAAARIFDYSTFGSDWTYKLGARYSPIRDVSLRGTVSSAFRAPSVQELFGGTTDSYEFTSDVCSDTTEDPVLDARCQSAPIGGGTQPGAGGSGDPNTQLLTKWISNPNLDPETADIFTAGIVVEPRWVPNLSLTVDYFNIQLEDAIGLNGTAVIMEQCYTQNNDAMCANVFRDADAQIAFVNDLRGNVRKTDTSGIDFAVRYALPTQQFGRFNFIVDGSYLLEYDDTDPFGFLIENAGTYDQLLALPKIKVNAGLGWAARGLGVGVATRYVGTYDECSSSLCASDASEKREVDWYMPFDAYVTYSLKSLAGTTSLALGVQNIFDEDPPYLYNAGAANSDPGTYDYAGRYFYVRVGQAF